MRESTRAERELRIDPGMIVGQAQKNKPAEGGWCHHRNGGACHGIRQHIASSASVVSLEVG